MNAPPIIFDRSATALHRARAARRDSVLVREATQGLAERLSAVNRKFEHAVEVGPRDGGLHPFASAWTQVDFADERLGLEQESIDLAVSVLTLQSVNDLPGALIQIRRALKPDGLFLAALFGGETLRELRDAFAAGESEISGGASPRVAPFADVRDLGALLQRAGFALPVADVERTTIRYREFSTLVGDLRALGETNALAERSRRFLRRDVLAASLARYAAKHSEPDGRLRATFDIVYLTGWAPHASQQKPLAPGSARQRLADALNTKEQPAGDKAKPI